MDMSTDETGGAMGEGNTALVPVREQSADFYGDGIPVAQTPDGTPYVALRPITDHLGVAFGSQRLRVLRDRVIAPRLRILAMAAADGRRREVLCLPLDLLPGFLFGIATGKVRPDLVEKIDRYRADCFRVLWEAFTSDALVPAAAVATPTDVAPSGAALALEIATAIQHLAQNQLELEQRVATVAGKQDVMADYVRGFIVETNRRLTSLERATATDATISDAQAADISLAVKALGDGESYARVYADMYKRWRISTYKSLPARSYAEVMDWLHHWYLEVAPPEVSGGPGTPTEGE
jgi:hypothetical protein